MLANAVNAAIWWGQVVCDLFSLSELRYSVESLCSHSFETENAVFIISKPFNYSNVRCEKCRKTHAFLIRSYRNANLFPSSVCGQNQSGLQTRFEQHLIHQTKVFFAENMNPINSSDWNEIPKFLRKRSKKTNKLIYWFRNSFECRSPLHAADLWCTGWLHSRARELIYDAQMLRSICDRTYLRFGSHSFWI